MKQASLILFILTLLNQPVLSRGSPELLPVVSSYSSTVISDEINCHGAADGLVASISGELALNSEIWTFDFENPSFVYSSIDSVQIFITHWQNGHSDDELSLEYFDGTGFVAFENFADIPIALTTQGPFNANIIGPPIGISNFQVRLRGISKAGRADDVVYHLDAIVAKVYSQNYLLSSLGTWNGSTNYAGIWGYTDSLTGKEYALICARQQGVSIVEVGLNPPQQVGFIPRCSGCTDTKEVKVYRHYVLALTEFGPIQVVDISQVTNPVIVSQITPEGNGAHNCLVEDNYLYVVGNHGAGGLEIFDLSNPSTPIKVGEYQPFYIHDLDIRNDTLYACGIMGDGVDVVYVGNKSNPQFLANFNYPGSGAHNVEISEDGRFVFVGDEVGNSGNWTRVFDVSDPTKIVQVAAIIIDSSKVVHNCYVKDGLLYIAHYDLGLRVWDVSDPTLPFEIGYYRCNMGGVWSVYPYFASGKIIASDMQSGLSVFRLESSEAVTCIAIPGDANSDCILSLTDIISGINYLFNKPGCSPRPGCWLSGLLCRGDWDGSSTVTLSDVIRGVNYIFNKPGGPWNAVPVGACCLP